MSSAVSVLIVCMLTAKILQVKLSGLYCVGLLQYFSRRTLIPFPAFNIAGLTKLSKKYAYFGRSVLFLL